MTVPREMKHQVRERLWHLADEVGWFSLSPPNKATLYEQWTRADEIGGVLERFMDRGKVRVYLKDTLLKDYTRARLADERRPLQALGVGKTVCAVEKYTKPHGRRLADGEIVCWGRAEDWNSVLMATYERAYGLKGLVAFGAVLLNATGRFDEPAVRAMIDEAAKRLDIQHVVWF